MQSQINIIKGIKRSKFEGIKLADQLFMGWPQRERMELEEMLKDELELIMAFSCCPTLNDIWMSLCL
uniref:Uncharacterized protein n=1 Tax=Helianthus annuus TaxID=4232 RepID=A0A251RLV5_HELAN